MKKNWVLWLAAALLVCLLPGMTREASAETGEVGEIVKRTCPACRNYTPGSDSQALREGRRLPVFRDLPLDGFQMPELRPNHHVE